MRMKISLRKANALQHSINEVIRELERSTRITVNEFEDCFEQVAKAEKAYLDSVQKEQDLLKVLFSIRKDVAKANVQAGISDRLAEVALLEKRIQISNAIATCRERMSDELLKGKVEQLKESKEDRYMRRDVETSIFDTGVVSGARKAVKALKRDKQNLQDELLELNVKTTITLSDESVKVLEGEGLI